MTFKQGQSIFKPAEASKIFNKEDIKGLISIFLNRKKISII